MAEDEEPRDPPKFRDLDGHSILNSDVSHVAFPLVATQPTVSYEQRVIPVKRTFTSQRRARSIRNVHFELRYPQPADPGDDFRARIILDLRLRLIISGIETKNIPDAAFRWLLPDKNAEIKDWNLLLTRPWALSPAKFRTMSLTRASTSTSKPAKGATVFYVRTYTLKVSQLLDLMEEIFDRGFGTQDKAYAMWEELHVLDSRGNSDEDVFIRYCGTSMSTTAWQRHQNDLTDNSPNFKNTFFQVCEGMLPNSVEIDELPSGDLPYAIEHDRVANLQERAVIALFGAQPQLNTATGGTTAEMLFDQVDNDEFCNLGTNLLKNIRVCSTAPTNRTCDTIKQYAQKARFYANTHTDTTGTAEKSITIEMCDLIAKSATPSTLPDGRALMVTIGSDLPRQMRDDLKPWFGGGFASANLHIAVMDNLARLEVGYSNTVVEFTKDMYHKGQLPFVDLFPWTKKSDEDLEAAAQLLRGYLQTTKPYIVTTMSNKVASVAKANFQIKGVHHPQMTKLSAVPLLVNYGEDNDNDPQDDDYCVLITCMHFGHLRYSTVREILASRLLSKTQAVVWTAMDIATQRVTRSQPGTTKRQICEQILADVVAKTGPATEFGKTLDGIKADYVQLHKDVYTQNDNTLGRRDRQEAADQKKQVQVDAMQQAQSQRLDITTVDMNDVLPASYFSGRSLPFQTDRRVTPRAVSRIVAELSDQLPFQPGDAMWVFNEFLAKEYPGTGGGTLQLANNRYFPEISSFWDKFDRFLRLPRYQNHPQLHDLGGIAHVAMNGQEVGQGSHPVRVNEKLIPLLHVLREDVSTTQLQAGSGERKRRYVVQIGDEVEGVVQYPGDEAASEELRNETGQDSVRRSAARADVDLGDQGDDEEEDHDLSEAIERSLQTFDQEGDEGKGKGKAADAAQRESSSDINDPDWEVAPRGTCRSGGIVGSGRAHLRTQYDAGGLMPAEQTRHKSRPDPEEEELAEAMAQSRELFEQERGAGELATAACEGPSRCMSRSRKVRRIVEDSDDDE